jgi:5-enolpyruvylshikimate-3-phosphate synthase
MSFSMLAFAYGSVEIDDRDCVKKSFPDFWAIFEGKK